MACPALPDPQMMLAQHLSLLFTHASHQPRHQPCNLQISRLGLAGSGIELQDGLPHAVGVARPVLMGLTHEKEQSAFPAWQGLLRA